MSELSLVQAAARGDEAAFRQIVEQNESAIAQVVTAMLGPGDDADDVGQETFIRFFHALPKFRGDATLRTYLTRIAVNLSIDAINRRRKKTGWIRFGVDSSARDIPAPDETTLLESSDLQSRVRSAIDDLDGDAKAVVVLRILEERSTREAAELLGVPEGTVMSRLKRAMTKLESRLKPLVEQ